MAQKINVVEKTKSDIKTPKNYYVILLNDDFTSMDFVVEVLISIFGHDTKSAVSIMLAIHNEGRGICGVYTYEIAETKVMQVHAFAKSNNFPLHAIIEEE